VQRKQTRRRQAESARSGQAPADLSEPLAPLLDKARLVASYLGHGDEPFVPPRPGWLLPVLLPDDDLDWAEYDGRLAPGRRGLQEPVGPRLGREALSRCDLVLVPALLVDRQGWRLGKGGGSYDRALGRATGLTVALLHEGGLVDALPHEPHDVPVQAVCTPSGVVRLPAA
jgi:5-formyltetrahydrofolate cyclo-ligase